VKLRLFVGDRREMGDRNLIIEEVVGNPSGTDNVGAGKFVEEMDSYFQ